MQFLLNCTKYWRKRIRTQPGWNNEQEKIMAREAADSKEQQ
jgi:hypothetical protein|tara:strand:- start:267 stop:389 length:123 start_codon:yes stop_codon:yes gene_type:complete